MRALHVCETCPVKHYDNCPSCFGFGVYPSERNGLVPIGAAQSIEAPPANAIACPTCKSTTKGIPTGGQL